MEEKETEVQEQKSQDSEIVVETVEDDMRKHGVLQEEEKQDAGATDDDQKAETEEKPKKQRKPSRAERRIRAQQERIKELEKKVSENEKAEEKPKEKPQEPNIDDFETYEEYEEELNKYEESLNDRESDSSKEEAPKQETTLDQNEINMVLEDGIEKYDDFKEVVLDDTLPLTEEALSLAIESDKAEDILYYIGIHKDYAEEIAGLSGMALAKEIGKLEVLVDKEVKKSGKKQTKAPEPIKPVDGGGVTPKTMDDDDISYEEYEKLLNKSINSDTTGFL